MWQSDKSQLHAETTEVMSKYFTIFLILSVDFIFTTLYYYCHRSRYHSEALPEGVSSLMQEQAPKPLRP